MAKDFEELCYLFGELGPGVQSSSGLDTRIRSFFLTRSCQSIRIRLSDFQIHPEKY